MPNYLFWVGKHRAWVIFDCIYVRELAPYDIH